MRLLARWVRGEPAVPDRGTVRAAREVRAFATRHAGERAGGHAGGGEPTVDAVVEYLGVSWARLVLVGQDGVFGDLVIRGVERAALAARLAGATVHTTFPPEVATRIRTGPSEWTRMAGIQREVR